MTFERITTIFYSWPNTKARHRHYYPGEIAIDDIDRYLCICKSICKTPNAGRPSPTCLLSLQHNYPVGETAYLSLNVSRLVKRYPVFSDFVLTLHLYYKWKSDQRMSKCTLSATLDPRYTSLLCPSCGEDALEQA